MRVQQLPQPTQSGIVDRLRNIEPAIKPLVVRPAEDQHHLPCFMHRLRYSQRGVFLEQGLGVDQKGLVPQKLPALQILSGVVPAGRGFEDVSVLCGDGIPDLGLSLVDVVDGGEVEVLLVPAEKCLPCADVAVRLRDSLHAVRHRVGEQRFQPVHIPLTSVLVHEGASEVGPVDGRRVHHRLPKLDNRIFTNFSLY